jgi:hypothetical protein
MVSIELFKIVDKKVTVYFVYLFILLRIVKCDNKIHDKLI